MSVAPAAGTHGLPVLKLAHDVTIVIKIMRMTLMKRPRSVIGPRYVRCRHQWCHPQHPYRWETGGDDD